MAELLNNTELNNDLLLIIENSGVNLNVKNLEDRNIILEGICAVFGKPNNNKRIYEKEEYLPHLSYLKQKIAKRQLVGDLDHPPHFEMTLKSASHIIEDLTYDGNDKVYIKLRILEETPNGKIAKALIRGGVALSVSSRAAGQVLNNNKVKIYKIITYDLVSEPGFNEAILNEVVNESLKNDFETIVENYEILKNNSIFKKENLEDISESLNFAENYKVYKIPKINKNNNKELKKLFLSIKEQKNNNAMSNNFVTIDQMNQYSEVFKQQIQNIKKELKLHKSLLESKNNDIETKNNNKAIIDSINYLMEHMEILINYSNYLSKKINENIKYSEHIAKVANYNIDVTNKIGKKLNENINYNKYLISYTEYLKNHINRGIKYMNYLGKELDESIQYIEYVAKSSNIILEYSDYLSNEIFSNRKYSQYLGRKISENIGYVEYIVKSINEGKVFPKKRNAFKNVSKIDDLVSKVDEAITIIQNKSANSVLEKRYPFLKFLNDENRKKFYSLDNETKQAIVETLSGSVWFNEADIVSIMEAVISDKNKDIPNYIKLMPSEYKEIWNNMNESEKNKIHAKAQLYKINNAYQAKTFWDQLDLRKINERIEIEKNNLQNMKKLNESQSTEGMIEINKLIEAQRGYSNEYINSLLRQANYRK